MFHFVGQVSDLFRIMSVDDLTFDLTCQQLPKLKLTVEWLMCCCCAWP